MKDEKEGGINEEDDVERYKSNEKIDWYEACESCQLRFLQKIETELREVEW